MFCRYCGTENSEIAQFCRQCGKPISSGGSVRKGPKRGHSPMRPATIAALAGVVAIAVLAVVLVVTIRSCSGGRASSDQVARDVEALYNKLLSSKLSDSGLDMFVEDTINMMPKEGVDALLEMSSLANSSEVSKMLREKMSNEFSNYKSYMNQLDMECSVYSGNSLSMSEIQSINEDLRSAGVNMHVTQANKLIMDITVTALEDFGTLSKGESKTQTGAYTQLLAVEVNGRWYLWDNSLV